MNLFKLYLITSPTNMYYVGITRRTLKQRANSNGSGYRYNTHLWRAIQKYGWENFTHVVLFDNLTEEEATRLERVTITLFRSDDHRFGYNNTPGGEGVPKRTSKTKGERNAQVREYHIKNRDDILRKHKDYVEVHREEYNEYQNKYYHEHKEKCTEHRKRYEQSEKGKASTLRANKSQSHKDSVKRYTQTEKFKECQRRYREKKKCQVNTLNTPMT